MTISLQGQAVVITGGAKRLGKAMALGCAKAGADVIITHFSSDPAPVLEELQGVAPHGRFEAFQLDAGNPQGIEAFVPAAFEKFPHITGLVNNAAIFKRTPFDEMGESDFDEHVSVNLKGPFLMSRAFAREFLQRGGGSIVNMADIYGIRPLGNYVPYCISKAGVVMMTQSLAKTLAPQVRVNCICPGTVLPPEDLQGEANEEANLVKRIPFGRLGTAEEIAQTAVFLLGGPSFITGAVLPVDGGQILR